jgi:hypothetical protein
MHRVSHVRATLSYRGQKRRENNSGDLRYTDGSAARRFIQRITI